MEYLGPLQGLLAAVILFVFKKKISEFVQKSFKRFPKYEDGAEAMNVSFEVRPSHIIIIASLFLFISIAGFLAILLKSCF